MTSIIAGVTSKGMFQIPRNITNGTILFISAPYTSFNRSKLLKSSGISTFFVILIYQLIVNNVISDESFILN